jgi:type II secretory pathway component PulC
MSFKYIILNLLVLFVVVMVAIENYDTWTQPIELLPERQETVKKSAAKAENSPPVATNKNLTSLRSFIVISEKNIFSPERKDFPILTVEKSNPVTRPQVILYGVTIAGDYQAASLVNPGRPLKKGERETMTVKIGEKIGEYKLAKIQPDRIIIESNGDSFEVLLYDSRNPKKRTEVKTEVKPATITSIQPTTPALASPPAAASAAAPTPAPAGKVPPAATVEKPKEPPQQQIAPALPAPTPRPIPPLGQRRRGTTVYPPPTSPPTIAPSTGPPGTPTQGPPGS